MNPPIDISDITLHTPRLLLRPWKQSDLEDFYHYACVDGVGQMAGWLPHENREKTQQILNSFIAHKKTFALEYQGKVIGSLGIEAYDEAEFPELTNQRCRELGFVLSRDYWGRGLMPEAVNAVVDWLFQVQKLDAIVCAHYDFNHQSAAVQRKCGFQYHSTAVRQTTFGTTHSDIRNILTRENWEKKL